MSSNPMVAKNTPDQAAAPKAKIVLNRELIFGTAQGVGAALPQTLAPKCALKSQKSCCKGKGYVVSVQEAYLRAEVCLCVKECPACFGRARLMSENDSTPCHTPEPNIVVNMLNAAHIPARYAQASIADFSNFSGNAQKFLVQLKTWQERFKPVGGKGVVITGPVGVGKTYLLAALAKAFAERGLSVRFTDFFQLLGELRSGFSEGKADSSQLAPLIDVDVLLIDELGKGRNKDFDKTVLDQLVTGRYNQNKTIIASTNYQLTGRVAAHSYNIDLDRDTQVQSEFAPDSFGSLEPRVGQRIFSRLREMCHFMELTGDDARRLEKPDGKSNARYDQGQPDPYR